MSTVVVLTGPEAPAHAAALARASDVVCDLDELADALHGHGDHVRHVALRAKRAAVDAAAQLVEDVTVWITHPNASPEARTAYSARGWEVR